MKIIPHFLLSILIMMMMTTITTTHAIEECAQDASYDVIIVGGGPAGLQSALTLGRALRKTLVIDAGQPRNLVASTFHNFLGQDGENPADFRKRMRETITSKVSGLTSMGSIWGEVVNECWLRS
jgi:NADPH-dependent 2,4-dienoyl-CoA reductase/sulfur reductase-like enzyme